MNLIEPLLRADFQVNETYRHRPGEPLDCPVTAFGGFRDGEVPKARLEPWSEVSRGRFRLVATRPDLTLSPEYVEAAYARGDVCRVAIRDGEVLGYMWRSTNGFTPHVDHVWISYPPDSYYASTAFVTPAARGAKTMRVLSRAIPTIMAEQGLHKQFGITALHNLSTRNGRKHPWSKRRDDGTLSNDIGYAGYVRRGGHAWCFHSPGVAREGFRFVATPWTAPGGTGADGLGRESGSAALPGAVEHRGAAAADAIGAGTVHG
jgi:hypothetical protein